MGPCPVLLILVLVGFPLFAHGAVSNEDIRLAILQIVNVVRTTDDKLERHEYRDRVLGEQLKKGMINIDKRVKTLDPLKGTISRLDERVAAIETILMQREEKEKTQLQKTHDIVLDIQKNLPMIIESLKNDIIERITNNEPPAQITEPTMSKKDMERIENEVLNRIDKVQGTINSLENELATIKGESSSIISLSNTSTENLEKVKRQLDTSEQLLAKYESKLAEYNNKIPELVLPTNDFKEQDEWKGNFLQALEVQKSQVKEVLNDVKILQNHVTALPNREDLETAQNSTMEKMEQIRIETSQIPTQSSKLLDTQFKETQQTLAIKQDNVKESINQLTDITSSLAETFEKNYEKIRTEIQALGKMDQVLVQTADNILGIKRRVEFGEHQILAELAKQIKQSSKDINQAIGERFDNFEFSILDEESGALTNLTSKIDEEIERVWRQIGIMHQQMSASTDTLNKLQNQTDAYVNGSLDVMGNMKGKVGEITSRMKEVDDNLNYLLGRLMLVTGEFNQIKHGLGKALDEIRASFHTVQEKVNAGPGPHKISSNEVLEEK